jgi:hypothetical protein
MLDALQAKFTQHPKLAALLFTRKAEMMSLCLAALSRWSRFPALRALDVSHNPLSEAGRAALRRRWNCEEGLSS